MSRLLMLRADWPASFRRTVNTGRKPRLFIFEKGQPVEVTDREFEALQPDIGLALFEARLDEKGRPRMIIVDEPAERTDQELSLDANIPG